jgi:hypothetical protein
MRHVMRRVDGDGLAFAGDRARHIQGEIMRDTRQIMRLGIVRHQLAGALAMGNC